VLGPLALGFVLGLLAGHRAKDTGSHPAARSPEVEHACGHGHHRDAAGVDQVDEVLQLTLLAVDAVIVPDDEAVDLALLDSREQRLVAGAAPAPVGGDVVVGIDLGDGPPEPLGQCPALCFLAGDAEASAFPVIAAEWTWPPLKNCPRHRVCQMCSIREGPMPTSMGR
jgi:hypothetical protein